MITVAAMLVIAKGVVKTGVIARATWRLLATVTTAGQALRRLIVPVGVASALGIAIRLGLNPVTLLALVATCISFTFINPFSHQSNLMVMGPGAYSTRTFARFGASLVVVSLATVSVVAWALLNSG